ncbi:Septin-8-A [Folsomia candida]|uniref:Septin-8-A n=1 Tax=Folsomia candida TaxID=158441 RepID=A0A226D8K0_FOLCA|nr:Septin-8-A [Folsomia candida]
MAHTTPGNASPREFTILLLGETGVGKSAWINGFANFVLFPDLSAAEENDIHCIVPTTFAVTDENYQTKLITVGKDNNEVMDVGQSATQHPKSYLFPKDGYIIRLIDTPGIGDVRGIPLCGKKRDKIHSRRTSKSVEEVDRLIVLARSCPPHAVQSTISLNTARQTILALGSPMAEVSRNIQLNIVMKQAHVELLKNLKHR